MLLSLIPHSVYLSKHYVSTCLLLTVKYNRRTYFFQCYFLCYFQGVKGYRRSNPTFLLITAVLTQRLCEIFALTPHVVLLRFVHKKLKASFIQARTGDTQTHDALSKQKSISIASIISSLLPESFAVANCSGLPQSQLLI